MRCVRIFCLVALGLCAARPLSAAEPASPALLIFDTDIGNDIDDALALAVIHALADRGECRLLAVTISKDYRPCEEFVGLVNDFYGRREIPIGRVVGGKTPEPSRYIDGVASAREVGRFVYPRLEKEYGDAVPLLRETLAAQADGSVTMVVVGFSTNMARLLTTPSDKFSELNGVDLVAKKVKLLSIMAGNYAAAGREPEYNVHVDLDAARTVYARWPTPIVASGFEVGQAIKYPATSIERDFNYVRRHPIKEAYALYLDMPYDRETWDLTSVLYAVRPDRGYFSLSEPGTITVDDAKLTQFTPSPEGRARYLKVDAAQVERVREALVQLASQPPRGKGVE